jgi:maleylacetoacetate isomerase
VRVYLNDVSNAPLRVRLALALKKMTVEEVHVDLERGGGEQHTPAFVAINPQRMLPVLVDGRHVVRQSLAIIEYLEEKKPQPALLPPDPVGKARVRSLALMVACDGQPLLNLRVRAHLTSRLGLSSARAAEWFQHWMGLSLTEYEAALAGDPATGRFSHGDSPTLADVCLVPQVLMARRFHVLTVDYPRVMKVFDACMALPEVHAVVGADAHAQR